MISDQQPGNGYFGYLPLRIQRQSIGFFYPQLVNPNNGVGVAMEQCETGTM